MAVDIEALAVEFPFLFEGTFIEASVARYPPPFIMRFPFLFEGTFIEAHPLGSSS